MTPFKKRHFIAISGAILSSIIFSPASYACSMDTYQGAVCLFGGTFTIEGFAPAKGQLLDISQNTALFSLYGTTYGGDGRSTFALPDLQGRSPIGQGRGLGLENIEIGQKGGSSTRTLSVSEIPSHIHQAVTTVTNTSDTSASSVTLRALAAAANTSNPTNAVLANSPERENIYKAGTPNVDMSADAIVLDVEVTVSSTATTTISSTGNSQPFNIRGPYLGMNWLVALTGPYPERD